MACGPSSQAIDFSVVCLESSFEFKETPLIVEDGL